MFNFGANACLYLSSIHSREGGKGDRNSFIYEAFNLIKSKNFLLNFGWVGRVWTQINYCVGWLSWIIFVGIHLLGKSFRMLLDQEDLDRIMRLKSKFRLLNKMG